jgi:hypothetical protein
MVGLQSLPARLLQGMSTLTSLTLYNCELDAVPPFIAGAPALSVLNWQVRLLMSITTAISSGGSSSSSQGSRLSGKHMPTMQPVARAGCAWLSRCSWPTDTTQTTVGLAPQGHQFCGMVISDVLLDLMQQTTWQGACQLGSTWRDSQNWISRGTSLGRGCCCRCRRRLA